MGEVVVRRVEKLLIVLEDPVSNSSADLFGLDNLVMIK